jgi:hypothetical protein
MYDDRNAEVVELERHLDHRMAVRRHTQAARHRREIQRNLHLAEATEVVHPDLARHLQIAQQSDRVRER